jgi:hypothetical protein
MTDDDPKPVITVRTCEGCGKRRIPTSWRLCETCQAIHDNMAHACMEP